MTQKLKDKKNAIEVHSIKKEFSYSSHKSSSIKRAITQAFKPKDKTKDSFFALNGISFNVEKGDFFGILGRNGSGKSTLLKIISEIYQPTSGHVHHDGKIVSFIELGVGFKSELSGKENVYLNAALLGFSREETDAMYDDIVEFAELEKFMGQQLKNYSSGMKVRLAFSVAIRAKADILILDEVLAVGDANFQKKCNDYFKTLKDDNKTVILVTHSMSNVETYCNKAIVIEDGKIIYEGAAVEAAQSYRELFYQEKKNKHHMPSDGSRPWINAKLIDSAPVLKGVNTLNAEIRYRNIDKRPVFIKVVVQYSGANLMITNAKIHHQLITRDSKEHVVKFSLNLEHYNWGDCRIVALLVDEEENTNIASFGYNNELMFNIPQNTKFAGIMKTTGKLELIK